MSDKASGDTPPSFETVDDEISDDQATLLATIHEADGGVPTGRLREATAIPYGSMNYHLSRLETWGLVDIVDRRSEGGGSPSKVWDTTERGETYLERPGPAGSTTVQVLMNHISDLERDLDRRDERIEALEADVEELKVAYNELAEAVETHLEN